MSGLTKNMAATPRGQRARRQLEADLMEAKRAVEKAADEFYRNPSGWRKRNPTRSWNGPRPLRDDQQSLAESGAAAILRAQGKL